MHTQHSTEGQNLKAGQSVKLASSNPQIREGDLTAWGKPRRRMRERSPLLARDQDSQGGANQTSVRLEQQKQMADGILPDF